MAISTALDKREPLPLLPVGFGGTMLGTPVSSQVQNQWRQSQGDIYRNVALLLVEANLEDVTDAAVTGGFLLQNPRISPVTYLVTNKADHLGLPHGEAGPLLPSSLESTVEQWPPLHGPSQRDRDWAS